MIVSSARWDDLASWFVVLPDCPAALPVAARLRGLATNALVHPSGRPWILGRWGADVVSTGSAGSVAVAVLGQHAVTSGELEAAAEPTGSVADLDRLSRSMVGSAHLVGSVGGMVRVQGSVTGLRRVVHARVDGVAVASDRADVLASLAGAELEPERLAVYLLTTTALHPLAGRSLWRGLEVLPGDRYLVLDGEGREGLVRHWTPPEPVVPMTEGAAVLREALLAAVEARLRGRDLVSTDLGGFDSTALCCVAAGHGAKVVAYTGDGLDPMTDDVHWARRTVACLPDVEHHVIEAGHLPMVYDGVLELDDPLDEPCAAAALANRYLFIAGSAAARGSRLHLAGFGGDELLAGSPAHLHAMLRRHPKIAWGRARAFAIQRRWPYRETARQLMDRAPFRAWLASAAEELTAPPLPVEIPMLVWGGSPRLPAWVSRDALVAVRDQLRLAARTAEPLAKGRGQHVELDGLLSSSRVVRLLGQMTGRRGIALAAPYYDDRVLEAGLSVRPEDRVTPWQYKPLIVEAMRGIAPDESLTRVTKDEGYYEVEAGLREHRAALLALFEDSRLGRIGLVDAPALAEVCGRPVPAAQFDALYQTVACEMWLRALEHRPLRVDGEGNGVQAA